MILLQAPNCTLGTMIGGNDVERRCLRPRTFLGITDKIEAISLELLETNGIPNKEDRLKIGTTLASALLRLHSTEWLSINWDKRDIFFPQRPPVRQQINGGSTTVWEPLLDHPFVRRSFTSQTSTPTSPSSTFTEAYKKNLLLPLGIVLTELSFSQRIEDLVISIPDAASPKDRTMSKFLRQPGD